MLNKEIYSLPVKRVSDDLEIFLCHQYRDLDNLMKQILDPSTTYINEILPLIDNLQAQGTEIERLCCKGFGLKKSLDFNFKNFHHQVLETGKILTDWFDDSYIQNDICIETIIDDDHYIDFEKDWVTIWINIKNLSHQIVLVSKRIHTVKASGFQKPNLSLEFNDSMETLFEWLALNGLTKKSSSYEETEQISPIEFGQTYGHEYFPIFATQNQRAKKFKKEEITQIKDKFKNKGPSSSSDVSSDSVWQAMKHKKSIVRQLSFQRLPSDAMAFYRPFHYPPFDQWGIYLLIGPLLRYHSQLTISLKKLKIFTPEIMMHLILFEIFHHEFFHHMAESTATSIEIICASIGFPKSIYLKYRTRLNNNKIDYPHTPLEEALANAYAYNSLSFICRIKAGYKTSTVKLYQKAIEKYWNIEPPGYKDAKSYINSGYIAGGAHLLAQMMGTKNAYPVPSLMKLSQTVMPSGFSAFVKKPDIPTWFVGSPYELETFYDLVPAPNETYTKLFWPYETVRIDKYIQEKKKKEAQEKKKSKTIS